MSFYGHVYTTALLFFFLLLNLCLYPFILLLSLLQIFSPCYLPALADSSTVKTYMHAGNTITNYANTAESLAPNGIKVTLHNHDLWAKFHRCTTEMIITKAGR